MMDMRSIKSGGDAETLELAIDFKKRLIAIHFALALRDATSQAEKTRLHYYRMEIRFSRLTQLIRPKLSGERAVVISMQHPPQFHRKITDVETTHSADRLSWTENDLWHRQVAIHYDARTAKDTFLSLEKGTPYVDIGRWTTYYLEFTAGNDLDIWSGAEQYLGDFNIHTRDDHGFEVIQRAEHKL